MYKRGMLDHHAAERGINQEHYKSLNRYHDAQAQKLENEIGGPNKLSESDKKLYNTQINNLMQIETAKQKIDTMIDLLGGADGKNPKIEQGGLLRNMFNLSNSIRSLPFGAGRQEDLDTYDLERDALIGSVKNIDAQGTKFADAYRTLESGIAGSTRSNKASLKNLKELKETLQRNEEMIRGTIDEMEGRNAGVASARVRALQNTEKSNAPTTKMLPKVLEMVELVSNNKIDAQRLAAETTPEEFDMIKSLIQQRYSKKEAA